MEQRFRESSLLTALVFTKESVVNWWAASIAVAAAALLLGGGPTGEAPLHPSKAQHLILQSAEGFLHIRIEENDLLFTPSATGPQGFQFELKGDDVGRFWPSVVMDLIPRVEDEVEKPRSLGVVANSDSASQDRRRSAGIQTFRSARRQYFHLAAVEGDQAQAQLGHGFRDVGGARLETTDFVDGWLSLVDLARNETLLRPARASSPTPLRVRIRDEDGYRDPKVTQ